MNKFYYFILLLILIFAFGLRFYQLDNIPPGLNQDESAIGYNAFSILKTGKDEHGKPYPLYFESFGDYKLPVYIYLTAISENVFGVDSFAVRFPSASLGFIAVFILFLFVRRLTGSAKIGLIASFLLAINPWHVFLSRAAFEVNAANTFLLLGIYCFYESLKIKRGIFLLFVSLLFIGLATYTYNITRLAAPTILVITAIYSKDLFMKRFGRWGIVLSSMILFVILLPFGETLFANSGLAAQKNVLIIGGKSLANLLEFRGNLIILPQFIIKIFFSIPFLIIWEYIKNLVASFNTSFLFASGSPTASAGLPNTGMFHIFEIVTITIGIVNIIKNKRREYAPIVIWFLVVILIVSLSAQVPHATRSFIEVVPLTIFSALGFYLFFQWGMKLRSSHFRYFTICMGLLLIVYSVTYFAASYFIQFPAAYSMWWRPAEKKLGMYLKENDKKYNSIFIDKTIDISYTSLLFYQSYPPEEFQKEAIWNPSDNSGFRTIYSFGKYHFVDIKWEERIHESHALVIMPGKFHNSQPIVEEFSAFTTTVVIPNSSGVMIQAPYTEIPFRAYESK